MSGASRFSLRPHADLYQRRVRKLGSVLLRGAATTSFTPAAVRAVRPLYAPLPRYLLVVRYAIDATAKLRYRRHHLVLKVRREVVVPRRADGRVH